MKKSLNKTPEKHFKAMALLFILPFLFIHVQSYSKESVWVRPLEIKFNYEPGNNNDALKIAIDLSTDVPVPEWKYINGNAISEKFAYIKGQQNRVILVSFDSNCPSSMHLLIKLTTITENRIGNDCSYFICNYTKGNFVPIHLTGSIPESVGKRDFTWNWEIFAIPIDAVNYCAATTIPSTNTSHTYYTLFSAPVSPNVIPWVSILDYACTWASGKSDANNICTDILNNGFNSHYTWVGNCHILSSNFVRLVSSLGINASMHKWMAWEPGSDSEIDDMSQMRTRTIDPVNNISEQRIIEWAWHQWAEAASYQRDPSANMSLLGNWGNYEDYLFTNYQKVNIKNPLTLGWVSNQLGQDKGCETEAHRYYTSYPSNMYIYYDWIGPDR